MGGSLLSAPLHLVSLFGHLDFLWVGEKALQHHDQARHSANWAAPSLHLQLWKISSGHSKASILASLAVQRNYPCSLFQPSSESLLKAQIQVFQLSYPRLLAQMLSSFFATTELRCLKAPSQRFRRRALPASGLNSRLPSFGSAAARWCSTKSKPLAFFNSPACLHALGTLFDLVSACGHARLCFLRAATRKIWRVIQSLLNDATTLKFLLECGGSSILIPVTFQGISSRDSVVPGYS